MEIKLYNRISIESLDSLPICVYYVEGIINEPFINKQLKFVKSKFYNTHKLSCYNFHKPSILKLRHE